MAGYRIFLLANDGHVVSCRVIEAENDREALEGARAEMGETPFELWLLNRRVATVNAEHCGLGGQPPERKSESGASPNQPGAQEAAVERAPG
jgi:hypothetical protein